MILYTKSSCNVSTISAFPSTFKASGSGAKSWSWKKRASSTCSFGTAGALGPGKQKDGQLMNWVERRLFFFCPLLFSFGKIWAGLAFGLEKGLAALPRGNVAMVFTKTICTSSDSILKVSLAQGSVGASRGRQAARFPGHSFPQDSKRATTGPF